MKTGKIRGLQQIASPSGLFLICAMDHRGSLGNMLNGKKLNGVGYKDISDFKLELCSALAPYSSAVLLDPIYGAAQCIANNTLPGNTGLLVSMEASGYGGGAEGRTTELLAGWNTEKVKSMGGSAAKLLLYYRPDMKDLAVCQRDVVNTLANDCQTSDLALLVEPKTYPLRSEIENPQLLAERMPELVIETAREITSLNIDVLKVEFPADMKYDKDEGKLLDLCRQLDEASRTPWVLLSAGVDYETFAKQVEIACRAGASGFLGGRAIWQEAAKFKSSRERERYLTITCVDRMKRLAEIASEHGRPWYKKTTSDYGKVIDVTEDWYKTYGQRKEAISV